MFAARLCSSAKLSTNQRTAACNRTCPRTSEHISLLHSATSRDCSGSVICRRVHCSARLVCSDKGGGTSLGMLPPVKHAFREAMKQKRLRTDFPSLSSSIQLSHLKGSISQGTNGFFPPPNRRRTTPTTSPTANQPQVWKPSRGNGTILTFKPDR